MAQYVRRRMASIQLSIAAAALGALAGVGLSKGVEPESVDAELAAGRGIITISGANITDGSVKFQDVNKKSFQKYVYLKVDADKKFVKITQAPALIQKIITSDLAGYSKLSDLGAYSKIDAADARYVKVETIGSYLKLTDADARFLKLGALEGYLKLDAADARFLKLDALDGYLKLTDADGRFLKLDALAGYLKLTDADGRFLKLADVDTRIEKHLTDNGYIKGADADARYVEGDGSVVTGSLVVGPAARPLLTVPKALQVDAQSEGQNAVLTLTNLSDGALDWTATGDAAGKGGVIAKGGSLAILIGLLQPTTVQVFAQDGSSVHTLSFSGIDVQGELRVVGQVLSGAPPAGG